MIPTDTYGRKFEKLRISLTNECNFNCIYCVGHEHLSGKLNRSFEAVATVKKNHLTAIQYKQCIAAIHAVSPLKQIRFTGGEPLLSPYLIELVTFCKSLGIKDVGLTSNGWYLERKINDLVKAGIDSLNISLDGFNDDVINQMAGVSNAHRVKETIIKAKDAGLPVKLNAVLMRGKNESEILPLLNFARAHNIPLRYIEFMEMGSYHQSNQSYLVKEQTILDTIALHHAFKPVKRTLSSTANYWELEQGGTFGIIANHSTPFCGDCNRLRLDSTEIIWLFELLYRPQHPKRP